MNLSKLNSRRLNNFKKNHRVLGVTPENIGKIAIKKGINTLIRYFDDSARKYILNNFVDIEMCKTSNYEIPKNWTIFWIYFYIYKNVVR